MANQIGNNSLNVDGTFNNVYNGTITISDNELSEENKRRLQTFYGRDYGVSELREYDIDEITKIVEEEMRINPTGSVGDFTVSYYQPYITRIINEITNQRNKIVKGSEIDINKSLEGLENLSRSADLLTNCQKQYRGQNIVSNAIKTRATELSAIIQQDIQKLPQYTENRNNALANYERLRSEFERKSPIARFFAKFTAKGKDLGKARMEAMPYMNASLEEAELAVVNNGSDQYQFAGIENPNNYTGRSR